MSIPYRQLLRMAGMKVNAVPGSTAAIRDANYLTSPLTIAQLGTRDFPFSNIKDICIATVGEIIDAYASVANHTLRRINTGETADIAHKGFLPVNNNAGTPIVGVYGAVRDSSDSTVLTKQPLRIIQTIVDNADNFLQSQYYYYEIIDRIIYHTRPNVIIEVCAFSASDELASLNANGDVPLVDSLIACAVDGMVARMIIDDEFVNQAQLCAQYYQAGLAKFRAGGSAYVPAPVVQASLDARAS